MHYILHYAASNSPRPTVLSSDFLFSHLSRVIFIYSCQIMPFFHALTLSLTNINNCLCLLKLIEEASFSSPLRVFKFQQDKEMELENLLVIVEVKLLLGLSLLIIELFLLVF